MSNIKAIIFDMDGLLIDSEPFWRRASKEVFASVGVDLTEEDMKSTMGRRIDEVVEHWFHERPWEGKSRKDIEAGIIDGVLELVKAEGTLRDGVKETLDICKSLNVPLAVASSSSSELIDVVISTLGIRDYFVELFSAEHETHGKPHPAVFISTASHLNVEPQHCLVFEDSPSGVLAAKAAKMTCIAVPDEEHFDHPFINTADLKLHSLTALDKKLLDSLAS